MSGTEKTILLVTAVGAGFFVLYKVTAGSTAARAVAPKPSTTTTIVGGLIAAAPSIATSLKGLFSSSPTSSSPISFGSGTDQAPALPAGFDTGNYTSVDNAGFTDVNGNFVLG